MVKMKNKKGWLKIVEAFIAVLLIASVVVMIYTGYKKAGDKSQILKIEDGLLDEITQNNAFRLDILAKDNVDIENFIRGKIPGGLNFTVKICDIQEVCNVDYIPEVYVRERIVSSTLQDYSPKRIRLFMWEI